jgi:hypothetical protein
MDEDGGRQGDGLPLANHCTSTLLLTCAAPTVEAAIGFLPFIIASLEFVWILSVLTRTCLSHSRGIFPYLSAMATSDEWLIGMPKFTRKSAWERQELDA